MADQPAHADGEGDGAGADGMVSAVLSATRRLLPDEVVRALREHGAAAGLADVTVLLADRDQRWLVALEADVGGPGSAEPIDGSLPGRCFQRGSAVIPEARLTDGHAWFPVTDGTARIGVLGAKLDLDDPAAVDRGGLLAVLAGYLIAGNARMGDGIARTVNARPIALAAEMRWASLPPLGFEHASVSVGAMLQPAYEIAGDAFDYAIDGTRLHVALFDAMGHGLHASTLANMALAAYRLARRERLPLQEMYRSIDEVVNAESGDESFVTAQLTTIDLDSGLLRSISAGHPRPLLLRDRTNIQELRVDAHPPIGIGHSAADAADLQLQPGDTLAYYSDGISEARSARGEQFGLRRLEDLLVQAAASDLSPAETARRAMHAVVEHHADHLDDDASLVLVTWHGPRT